MALLRVEHSIVAEVIFSGFRSDTYSLQRNGWELAFEPSPRDFGMGRDAQMVLRHREHHVVALAEGRGFYEILAASRRGNGGVPRPMFNVVKLSNDLHTQGHRVVTHFRDFTRIDATPTLRMMEDVALYDLPAFAPMIAQPTKEDLIVEPADVSAMLDMIRKQQSAGQAEIRERARRREIVPIQHAAIYTLPLAA